MRWKRSRFAFTTMAVLVASAAEWVFPGRGRSEMFVVTDTSVRVFADTADGNAVPKRSIQGAETLLGVAHSLALDLVHREVFVTAGLTNNSHVLVFAMSDSGNVAPLRDISGDQTQLSSPNGIVVDVDADEIWVANGDGDSITVFRRGANGNQPPLRTITGGNTTLFGPGQLFLDKLHHNLFVSDQLGVKVFNSNSSGDIPPSRTLAGESTQLGGPSGLFLDLSTNELTVASNDDRVLTFPRTASGDVAPLRGIDGAATGLDYAEGIVRTTNAEVLVANSGTNGSGLDTLTGYAAGANGNVSPSRTISGANPSLDFTNGVTSTRALGCAAGFVGTTCIFQDDFQDGDLCRWAAATSPPSC
ncbi:MAG: hypothetical protein U0610_06110 [bacterium]